MVIPNSGAPDAIVVPNEPYGFKVVPPVVPKHAGETFTVLNATNVPVNVSFPALVTNPPESDIARFDRVTFVIDSGTTAGVYDYHVTIVSVTQQLLGFQNSPLRASADSDPRIIID